MIVKREFLMQIGGFDPKYFYYYDDDYLSFRIWISGKRVVTVPRSKVHHFLSGTSGADDFFRYRHALIGTASLMFDIYWNLFDLAKSLLIFFMNRFLNDLLLLRKIVRFRGSISGALWILKNLKYIWGNRLQYWSKAAIDERKLRYSND